VVQAERSHGQVDVADLSGQPVKISFHEAQPAILGANPVGYDSE
jgi:hypothetical protein